MRSCLVAWKGLSFTPSDCFSLRCCAVYCMIFLRIHYSNVYMQTYSRDMNTLYQVFSVLVLAYAHTNLTPLYCANVLTVIQFESERRKWSTPFRLNWLFNPIIRASSSSNTRDSRFSGPMILPGGRGRGWRRRRRCRRQITANYFCPDRTEWTWHTLQDIFCSTYVHDSIFDISARP